MTTTDSFFELTPERILDAVETSGLRCTGRCLTLNSMENRVYEVEIDQEVGNFPHQFLIAKFYRPGRWNVAQILEEHQFLADLVADEVPTVAPVPFSDGKTLREDTSTGILYTLFPKARGRAPEELNDEQLQWLGRLIARLHITGSKRDAPGRLRLNSKTYGIDNLEFLEREKHLPMEVAKDYRATVEEICKLSEPLFAATKIQRIHGDCHPGNILWGNDGPFFVDFDDMVVGPCIQDLWLLTSGRDTEGRIELDIMLEGYEQLREFDRRSVKLIEPLRALRYIHFSAWIARRWQDPYFQRTFPHFGTVNYWSGQLADLKEQLSLIQNL